MRTIEKVVYTAHTHTTGGREGAGTSSDGALDVQLSTPGSGRPGTNPEQLFGIGYSACFMGAMRRAAATMGARMPDAVSIDADVSLGTTADEGYALAVKLTINLPGLTTEHKQQIVADAHQLCPYSHATRGNIDVRFEIL